MTGGIFFGAGPYFGYGIGGKWKDNYSDPDNGKLTFKNDVSEDDWDKKGIVYGKPMDAGLNLLAGYEITNNLSVQLNGQFGLMNLVPKYDGEKLDGKVRNFGIGISIGYRF